MLGVVRGTSIAVVYPQDVAGLQPLFFFFQVSGRLCQLPLGENEGVRGGGRGALQAPGVFYRPHLVS